MKKIIFSLAVFFTTVFAQAPAQINFQGQLVNADGSTAPNGEYALEFTIFDAVTDGNSVWTETQMGVPVSGGVFSVALGKNSPIVDAFSGEGPRFIQVRFQQPGASTFQSAGGRQQILSVPFALNAELVQGVDVVSRTNDLGSKSATEGFYSNRIPDRQFSVPVSEFCIKEGVGLLADATQADTDLSGGDCGPGDIGWVLEQDYTQATEWSAAKLGCALKGMRLPSIFEYQAACNNPSDSGLLRISNSAWQWVDSPSAPFRDPSSIYRSFIVGRHTCFSIANAQVGVNDVAASGEVYAVRCAR